MIRRFPIRSHGGVSWIRGTALGGRALPPLPAQLVANAERVLSRGLVLSVDSPRPLRVLRGGVSPLRRADGAS